MVLGERVFDHGNDHVTMSNVEAARAATSHLIERGRRRIALLGSHPGEIVGSEAGRSIPEDVAVIGFDDIDDAAFTSPTLSTVSPGREQIAERAVELLATRIQNRVDGTDEPDRFVRVDADFEVIARESTGS